MAKKAAGYKKGGSVPPKKKVSRSAPPKRKSKMPTLGGAGLMGLGGTGAQGMMP